MAKVIRIPLGEKPRGEEGRAPGQAQVSLAQLGGKVRQGLLAFAVAVGLDVFATLLEEIVTRNRRGQGQAQPLSRCLPPPHRRDKGAGSSL